MDNDRGYDKIKHLVEIEDDIFAVFTINSKGEVNDFNIAKNIDIEKKKIYSKKVDNKGRKILGKILQGHSPIYE